MKLSSLLGIAGVCVLGVSSIFAQSQPDVVWEVPTPSGLANRVVGIGWSPDGARVAVGSSDRWVRSRQAGNGALVYSVLEPIASGSADQTIYSTDGAFLAVHSSGSGLGYRVHRAADGVFLGTITVTIDGNGLVDFAPDAQLLAAAGGDEMLSRWRVEDFTVVLIVGTGYRRTTTTFNFSPDGSYQSTASRGTITIQRRSNGAAIARFAGGPGSGFTPAAFTPDNTAIAAWSASPNQVTLWRLSDGAILRQFPGATADEGVGAIRFTPDGARLVTTGYLPYVDQNGLWQQVGVIRFWGVPDGTLRSNYYGHTGIGVTSPIAWSPDSRFFVYGTYEGTTVVARTPAP
jgi:WD40 repeat protein